MAKAASTAALTTTSDLAALASCDLVLEAVFEDMAVKQELLRKLDAMEANLTRLNDLTAELRRQLKPLGRQAEVARRAVVIQTEVRDARLRLMADDLVRLRESLAAEVADETALRERQADVDAQIAGLLEQERAAEEQAAVSRKNYEARCEAEA